MTRPALLCVFTLLLSSVGNAQTVPEGTHKLAQGPETICGVTASSALDFERQMKASPDAQQTFEDERFVAFEGPDELTLWVFAKSDNAAYPLATCRRVYTENGHTMMGRKMRCDDTRERCDRAFLEFQALDQQASEAVQHKIR